MKSGEFDLYIILDICSGKKERVELVHFLMRLAGIMIRNMLNMIGITNGLPNMH